MNNKDELRENISEMRVKGVDSALTGEWKKKTYCVTPHRHNGGKGQDEDYLTRDA